MLRNDSHNRARRVGTLAPYIRPLSRGRRNCKSGGSVSRLGARMEGGYRVPALKKCLHSRVESLVLRIGRKSDRWTHQLHLGFRWHTWVWGKQAGRSWAEVD